jgi:hypothetical protein
MTPTLERPSNFIHEKMEWIWKDKAVEINFKFRHLPGRSKKNYENFQQYSRCS